MDDVTMDATARMGNASVPVPSGSRVSYGALLSIAVRHLRGLRPRSLPVSPNLMAHLRFVASLVRVRFRWEPETGGGALQRRAYKDYETYLAHQAGKLPRLNLTVYDREYREVLRARLGALPRSWRGTRVLCLGARIGTEVKAFLDLGAFAVGVDVNPGPKNRYVVHGDFHDLQYADGSVDVVFSNSFDHAYDLPRLMAQIRRVLQPEGTLILEIGHGLHEGGCPEFYESLCWSSVDALVAEIEREGFTAAGRHPYTRPASGVQVLFGVRAS